MSRHANPVAILLALAFLVPPSMGLTQQSAVSKAAQDAQDWTPLFNGRDLDGWTPKFTKHPLGENLNDTVRVEDGLLKIRYDKWTAFNGEFGHLFYKTPFSYYRLVAEYRFVGEQLKGGAGWAMRNNGLMLHAPDPRTMLVDQDFPISLEAQLLGGLGDGKPRPTANLCTPGTHVVMNGSLYTAHCVNSTSKTYDGDQWVRVEVEVLGDERIRHIVEGQTVLEYSKPQIGGGNVSPVDPAVKVDGTPLAGGYIALQAETAPIDFRKIELLNLEGCMDPKAVNYKSYFVKSNPAACRWTSPQGLPGNVELTTFPAEWTYRPGAPAPRAENGMVASNCALATEAGVETLKAGGNAVDAAVAVGFALAVAYPEAGNIGGGGYAVLRMADGRTAALDYRETAPAAASRDMFIGADGKPTDASLVGHRASGVPGSVAGLLALLEKHGSLPRARVMAPAIRLARDGFLVDDIFRTSIAQNAKLVGRFGGAGLFLPANQPPAIGARFVQADLANTLERIARDGRDGFYTGAVASAIVGEMARGGGIITAADLAGYQPVWRTPITSSYRGHGLIAMPPSSSGGITLVETLNILETWPDVATWGSAAALHRLTSAFQRAFVDRNETLGDPAFVKMPLERLASKAYAKELRAGIREDRASATASLKPAPRESRESRETTNYAVVDARGNAVAITTTINSLFGSGVWVPGAGFFLNNEMDDFAAQPGTANQFGLVQGESNAVAPGKRMLSAMAPTIVLDTKGSVEMLIGGRGGPRIITAVVQAIVNVIDHHMTLADAVGAPRIHHQALPDVLEYEKGGVPAAVVDALAAMGYSTKPGGTGSLTAIRRTATGWEGLFDPRKHGLAAGY